MCIIRFISSIILFMISLVIGIVHIIFNSNSKYGGSFINDIIGGKEKKTQSKLVKTISTKYAGDDDYTNIDEAEYSYVLDRTKNIFGSNNNESYVIGTKEISNIKKKKYETHSWYKYKTWNELMSDKNLASQYREDVDYARTKMLFNWEKVYEKVVPLLKEEVETIGVIRAESDKKTLYIYGMERAPNTGASKTYAASVPVNLVKKYCNMPGYFVFHTHPGNNGDPLPSDADIYNSLLDCYSGHFIGHVVIGAYGAVIYFLQPNQLTRLFKEPSNKDLKFLTYCYDLLSAWNAICNSSGPMNEKDRVSFLEHWSYDMIVYPFPEYVSITYKKVFTPRILTNDRFIETKYDLLNNLKEFIKELERDEYKNKKN